MSQFIEQIVPLRHIARLSPLNPRQDMESGGDTLAATIRARGLLQPIILVNTQKTPADPQEYEVLDGGRRWRALRLLQAEQSEPIRVPARVFLGTPGEAREAALIGAVTPRALHPVLEFEAFSDLEAAGFDVPTIARDFGETERHVRQRLALGRLSPRVRALWFHGDVSRDIAEAFTAGSIEAQEALLDEWDGCVAPDTRPYHVRKALRANVLDASDARVKFLLADPARVAVYQANKGRLEESLFSEETIFLDPAIVDRVVDRFLLDAAERAMAVEGWGAALIMGDEDPDPLEIEPDYLEAESDRLEQISDARLELPDEDAANALDQEEEQIDRRALLRAISQEWRATLGVRAQIDAHGRLEIIRAVPLAGAEPETEEETTDGRADDAPVRAQSPTAAPRENKPKDRKSVAPIAPALPPAKIGREIKAILDDAANAALEDVTSRNPGLALTLAVAALGCSHGRTGVRLGCDGFSKSKRRSEVLRAIEHVRFEQALLICVKAPLADLTAAFCEIVGISIDVTGSDPNSAAILLAIASRLSDISAALARGLDYRGYFESSPRDAAIEAIRAVDGDAAANEAGRLRKPELVKRAALLGQDRAWLPEIFTAAIRAADTSIKDERSTAQAMREAIDADEAAQAPGVGETSAADDRPDMRDPNARTDAVRQFLAARCTRGADVGRIKAQTLFDRFKLFVAERDWPPIGQGEFGEALAALGVGKTRLSTGYHYLGVALRQADETSAAAE